MAHRSVHVWRALLFDLDGTLTRPRLDFARMRAEIGVPPGESILAHLDALSPAERAAAREILDRHEMESAELAEPNVGFDALMEWLDPQRHFFRVGIVTRNSRHAAHIALARLRFGADVVVTREDTAPKPAPDAVRLALEHLGVGPAEAVMIGDFRYDIEAGKAAGVAATVFVSNDHLPSSATPAADGAEISDARHAGADVVVSDLRTLAEFLRVVARVGFPFATA